MTSSSGTPACSPVTDFLNPNVAGGPTERIFVSVQNLGASADCLSAGCIFNFKDTPWQPLTAYSVGQEILDTHFQIQVVSVAGTSASSTPSWSAILGSTTSDGTVQWLNQGPESAFTPAAWIPSHGYPGNSKILDGNNNVQLVTTPGTSGSTMPTFNTTAGGTTADTSKPKETSVLKPPSDTTPPAAPTVPQPPSPPKAAPSEKSADKAPSPPAAPVPGPEANQPAAAPPK